MWRVSTVLELSGLSQPHKSLDPKYRERGTAIHAAAEAISEGYEPVVEQPEWQPYVDGLRDWFRDFSPHVVAQERRIVDRVQRLTGRLDMAIVLQRLPIVVDIKTGGESPWHGFQLAGYEMLAAGDVDLGLAWIEAGGPTIRGIGRAVLYLPGDGTYRWRVKADPTDGYYFRSALALLRWRHEHGLLHVTDEERPEGEDVVTTIGPETAF